MEAWRLSLLAISALDHLSLPQAFGDGAAANGEEPLLPPSLLLELLLLHFASLAGGVRLVERQLVEGCSPLVVSSLHLFVTCRLLPYLCSFSQPTSQPPTPLLGEMSAVALTRLLTPDTPRTHDAALLTALATLLGCLLPRELDGASRVARDALIASAYGLDAGAQGAGAQASSQIGRRPK